MTTTFQPVRSGRGWAYAAAALGGTVSIAANVAHTYVATTNPATGAVLMSVFWPVALFVAVEVNARVAWPTGWRAAALRWGGLAPVAAVAALVSYRHLAGLLTSYGEDPVTAAVGPLAVDGLMVMATAALILTARTFTQTTTTDAPVVDAPAPTGSGAPEARTAPAVPTGAVRVRPGRGPGRPAGSDARARVAKALAAKPGATQAQIAAAAGVSERTVRRVIATTTTESTTEAEDSAPVADQAA